MIYFASDFHLGLDARLSSRDREKLLVRWLEMISKDAKEVFLVGDLFDFWFEYRSVVPKGFTRFFGQLARMKDKGIQIHVFTGNHDMWMFDYFEEELDIPVYKKPIYREWNGKKFFIGHGDGLGPGDYGYKIIKKIFAHPLSQWLFSLIHPTIGTAVAQFWSKKSRDNNREARHFLGPKEEWLVRYSEKKIEDENIDFFIFGHRHLTIDFLLKNKESRYINLGEWLQAQSYAVFDGRQLEVRFYENNDGIIYG